MYTLYERMNRNRQEQAFGTCMGKIIAVDSEKRTCTVATMMGVGTMNDQFIESCQWTSQDANPEGDESGSIPRVGSWSLVHFVDGEPFLSGFIRPIGKDGSAKQGTKGPTLNEGDKLISTRLGNRISAKANGLLELWAKDNLQRTMMPQGSQILDICRRYNLKTDGGYIDWKKVDKLGNTAWKAEYSKDLLRTSIISELKGYVSPTIVKRTYIGASFPGVTDVPLPVYTQDIYTTGELLETITPGLPPGSPAGYSRNIKPDGSIEILGGSLQTFKMTIDSLGAIHVENALVYADITETGDVEIAGPVGTISMDNTGNIDVSNAAASLSITAEGETTIATPLAAVSMTVEGDIEISGPTCTITLSAAGEVKIDGSKSVTLTATNAIDLKSFGTVNVEGMGPINIKTIGQIMLDGGTGASDNVLCYPTTLSPFTGAPLVPFSTTIMVSK